jgi:hypothetical protein
MSIPLATAQAPEPCPHAPSVKGRVFVGRGRELAELRARLEDALAGRGQLVLLAGEPGIGKTRTADELANEARRRHVRVLVGRCYEGEGAPPYWPWVQVLRAYIHDHDPATLQTELGPYAADIAHILPILRERLPSLPALPALAPEQARFRLFDAVTAVLKTAAKREPFVLLLDDLHWADKASALLLSFLAQELGDARMLIVGTYRDVELGRQHPLAEILGDLARQQCVSRIRLHGLDEEEVSHFIEGTTGRAPSLALVAAVHRETEGNPLFVTEVVRLLEAEGRLAHPEDAFAGTIIIPQAVREVIGRRLSRLSPACNRVLTLAAVIGREFSLNTMEQASGVTRPDLLTLLDEATAVHILVPVRTAVGRYRFSHALIRETLYDEVSTARRVQLHRQIGEALEALHGGYADARLERQLAHHFFQSAAGGDAERAVRYLVRAAENATTALAFEEAANHYERALQVLELGAPANGERRCALLLALGESQARAGDRPKARESFLGATELARRVSAPESLARAALGFSGPLGAVGVVDRAAVGLLEEALAALPEEDTPLRARVLGRLAVEGYYSDCRSRNASLIGQATAMARRVGDVEALGYALTATQRSLWRAESLADRLATAEEFLQRAEQAGHGELALEARAWRMRSLLEQGDIRAVDGEIEAIARLAQDQRHPFFLLRGTFYRAMRALLDGRFDDAQRLTLEARATGQRVWQEYVGVAAAIQMATLCRTRGPFAALVPVMEGFVAQYPTILGGRAMRAVVYAELGRVGEARHEFDQLASHDFADLPEDNGAWLSGIALLAEACALLGDAPRATLLYELLRPYAHQTVVAGLVDCYGSASRYLGLLATTLARWDDAVQHFTDALAMNARLGARPYVALTQQAYAAMLLARDRPGDRAQATSLLAEAAETARELGMTVLAEKLAGLQDSGARAAPPGRPQDPAAASQFRRDGDYWTIGDGAGVFRLKDSIGLRRLAQLLRHPGREFLALDILAMAERGGSGPSEGDTGALLDGRAKSAYRRRLEELRAAAEEAEASGDGVEAVRLQEEIDFLGREIARALGLGGRDRRAASAAERARLNVTRSIQRAVQHIATHDATLGRHLAATVKTGTFCSYDPAARAPLVWTF